MPTNNTNPTDSGHNVLIDTIQSTQRPRPPGSNPRPSAIERRQSESLADRTAQGDSRALEAQITRTWTAGDIYAPHDLSPSEMQKARFARNSAAIARRAYRGNTRKKGGKDVIDDLGIDPMKEYKNFAMISEYVSEMGRIKHGRETGLRGVNQRRMARAVRRAVGIGIMPSVHRHPELMSERMAGRTSGWRNSMPGALGSFTRS